METIADLATRYPEALNAKVREFKVGNMEFHFNTTHYLMGVINLSPDSWYRESVCLSAKSAIQRGVVLKAQGAHIIDVGAESSLASAMRMDASAQTSKLLPVVKELAAQNVLVSVETYHPKVTQDCLRLGAKILNLTGVEGSSEMFRMVADHDAGVIICFVEGANVREVRNLSMTSDPIDKLSEFFARQIDLAMQCGVTRIWIDPGQGFYYANLQDSSSRVRHQMKVFLNTFRLRKLGVPICHALPHAFEFFGEEVRSAEPFFAMLASLGGTNLYRTHEVPRTKAVLDTMGCWTNLE